MNAMIELLERNAYRLPESSREVNDDFTTCVLFIIYEIKSCSPTTVMAKSRD